MFPSTVSLAATIFVFVAVIFLTLKQPTVRIPFIKDPVTIDYGLAPLIGAVTLLLFFTFGRESVVNGIIGTPTIKPYSILILFMSLAYICGSLDLTGFFDYLALLAARAAGNSGKRLFVYFFLLSSVLTLFTSNDIVILTMTPIICYCARNTDADPIPYLVAQFFAANIWSVALYIGNPTNIIVAQAYGLTFLEYSKWMAVPTLVAGATCFALLWFIFRKRIPDKIKAPTVSPEEALKDKNGAIFGIVCFLICLVLLGVSEWIPVEIWVIPFAVFLIMLGRDIYVHYLSSRQLKGLVTHLPAMRLMPWKVVPFAIGSFIMVENLSCAGWIEIFAGGLAQVSTGLIPATIEMGFLSSLVANLVNNQPMTILFTRILEDSSFAVPDLAKRGSMFALIMGSNFGANFSFMGALAGLMWVKICADKGVKITLKEFAKYGAIIMPTLIILSCLALAGELMLWS